jgi:hypothetical protein
MEVTMESILFRGGLEPTIGILDGGELGGEGVHEGATGNESLSGMGNNRGFREKANRLKSADASLRLEVETVTRGGVVNIGVGKSPVVLGLCQSRASGERGVTRIFPSNLGPGGENSVGTLPKFKKRETSEKGLLIN